MDEERVKQLNKCKAIMDAVFSMGASYQIASSVIEMEGADPDTVLGNTRKRARAKGSSGT